MFYSNEVNLQNYNSIHDMIKAMEIANIDRAHQVTEIMATKREDLPEEKELSPFKETYVIKIHNINIEVVSSLRYQRYTNGSAKLIQEASVPMLGYVIQRKNAKKGLESITLNHNDLRDSEAYQNIKAIHKARVLRAQREIIANQVLEARASNVIDTNKSRAYGLQIDYEALDSANEFEFLEENGFTGLENLGIHESRPDGYGHTCGRSTHINFENKTIYVQGWSSDD